MNEQSFIKKQIITTHSRRKNEKTFSFDRTKIWNTVVSLFECATL